MASERPSTLGRTPPEAGGWLGAVVELGGCEATDSGLYYNLFY